MSQPAGDRHHYISPKLSELPFWLFSIDRARTAGRSEGSFWRPILFYVGIQYNTARIALPNSSHVARDSHRLFSIDELMIGAAASSMELTQYWCYYGYSAHRPSTHHWVSAIDYSAAPIINSFMENKWWESRATCEESGKAIPDI